MCGHIIFTVSTTVLCVCVCVHAFTCWICCGMAGLDCGSPYIMPPVEAIPPIACPGTAPTGCPTLGVTIIAGCNINKDVMNIYKGNKPNKNKHKITTGGCSIYYVRFNTYINYRHEVTITVRSISHEEIKISQHPMYYNKISCTDKTNRNYKTDKSPFDNHNQNINSTNTTIYLLILSQLKYDHDYISIQSMHET